MYATQEEDFSRFRSIAISHITKGCLAVANSSAYLLTAHLQVYVTQEEVQQIKGAGEGGMTLLGFKPARCALLVSALVVCLCCNPSDAGWRVGCICQANAAAPQKAA